MANVAKPDVRLAVMFHAVLFALLACSAGWAQARAEQISGQAPGASASQNLAADAALITPLLATPMPAEAAPTIPQPIRPSSLLDAPTAQAEQADGNGGGAGALIAALVLLAAALAVAYARSRQSAQLAAEQAKRLKIEDQLRKTHTALQTQKQVAELEKARLESSVSEIQRTMAARIQAANDLAAARERADADTKAEHAAAQEVILAERTRAEVRHAAELARADAQVLAEQARVAAEQARMTEEHARVAAELQNAEKRVNEAREQAAAAIAAEQSKTELRLEAERTRAEDRVKEEQARVAVGLQNAEKRANEAREQASQVIAAEEARTEALIKAERMRADERVKAEQAKAQQSILEERARLDERLRDEQAKLLVAATQSQEQADTVVHAVATAMPEQRRRVADPREADPKVQAWRRLLDSLHCAEQDVAPFLALVSGTGGSDDGTRPARTVLTEWHSQILAIRTRVEELFARANLDVDLPIMDHPSDLNESMKRLMNHAALFTSLLSVQQKQTSPIMHWSRHLPEAVLQLYWKSQTQAYITNIQRLPMPMVPDAIAPPPPPPAVVQIVRVTDEAETNFAKRVLRNETEKPVAQ